MPNSHKRDWWYRTRVLWTADPEWLGMALALINCMIGAMLFLPGQTYFGENMLFAAHASTGWPELSWALIHMIVGGSLSTAMYETSRVGEIVTCAINLALWLWIMLPWRGNPSISPFAISVGVISLVGSTLIILRKWSRP